MDNTKKSTELRDMARRAGLCDEWFGEWKDNSSDDVLIGKYLRGIDFAIKNEYPSVDYILNNWDKETLRRNKVFIDEKDYVAEDIDERSVVMGNSNMEMYFGDYIASDVYVRHRSILTVIATGHAVVMLNLYDGCEVTVNSTDMAKVYIYKHSSTCTINDVGDNKAMIRFADMDYKSR